MDWCLLCDDIDADQCAVGWRYAVCWLCSLQSASAALTRELKGMSVEQLKAGDHKAMLEARDLEDVLYGNG